MAEVPDKIVVGVDGSAESRAALAWALRQARLTGGHLLAVRSWDGPSAGIGEVAPDRHDLDADVARDLGEIVADVAGGEPGVHVTREVAHGHPAKALLDAAADADLLVLGNRGRGGFTAALLGSVTQYCTHYAACPVVVVRPDQRSTG
ncbi:universal stress protein [Saccharopolyspora cebuensis]|uniref:Universal stress protein n=1 Tax=Saccharopolyspora cebuensis TaxID=418759 RepID=A0ABV4CD35_9PSEU